MVVDADNNLSIAFGNGFNSCRGFRSGAIYLYIVLIRLMSDFRMFFIDTGQYLFGVDDGEIAAAINLLILAGDAIFAPRESEDLRTI
jgi:hypothetical protein